MSVSLARRAVIALVALLPLPLTVRAQQSVTIQPINVTGEPVATPHPHDDTRPKLEHIMREVTDTQITVTKKATVIRLDKQAPNEGNNLQELF
ncbi:MAG TPA: hypothetical protein VGH00_09445, partial [Chthoniobacterales bacterium]